MTTTFDLRDSALGIAPALQKFPSGAWDLAGHYCAAYFEEMARAASTIDLDQVERAASILVDAYTRGATVFSCGNGGSASISNHLQCDHSKGVRNGTDLSPRVISLTTNMALLTAIANDIGYEKVFTHQLESNARPGDVLVVISSSGRSPNIVEALSWAREHKVRTIALTGFSGGEARQQAEAAVHIESENYGVIEDLHQAVMHAIAQYIRQSRMSDETVAVTTF